MHLATDYIHPTPRDGRCRVRVWLPEDERDAPVVVCSELPADEGASVTNVAEPRPLVTSPENWLKQRDSSLP